MKLLPLAVSLPSLLVLLIFIQSTHSTPILDPINIDTDFIKAAKEIITFVRSDIDELDKETGNFETAKIRENQLKVIQHLNNVTIQVRQIKNQLTPSEEWWYLDFYLEFQIMKDSSTLLLSFGYFEFYYRLYDYTPQDFDNFVESISGLTIDRFPLNPNSTNVFYQIIHGFECKQHDDKCKKIIKRFNKLRNISKIPKKLNYEKQQSPQQLYYSLYKEIALGELMAYILIEYSLMIKKVSANGNFITKRNAVRHNYDEITKNALNSLKHVTEKADRALWRRDPDERVYNETFAIVELNEENGDRYFNLRETLSDVKANKVVTGIRFVNKNHIFHLQIQQGELLPRGIINESTVEWIPIDNYEIGNSNVKEGVDYHTLSDQSRAIDLDDVIKTDDNTFVVTGVRFQVVNEHLNLKVHLSKFDFVKGKLVDSQINGIWQSKENVYNRQKISVNKREFPAFNRYNLKLSKDPQYIEFTNMYIGDIESKLYLPFIDLQNVELKPPLPLAGIGIYHRGEKGFGGHVAPKIISYDLSPHISSTTY